MSDTTVFLDFVPELKPLMLDTEISEIQCNGPNSIFVERAGRVGKLDLELKDQGAKGLRIACEVIAQSIAGVELTAEHPICDSRLPDGSRVAVVRPPVSVDGDTLTIRKHQRRYYDLFKLEQGGTLSAYQSNYLAAAVGGRKNILIAGSTGSGKTTILNALAELIPATERVIILEDTTEIVLSHPNQRRFEAQQHVPMDVILKACLRQSPDRLLLGEVRGKEAFTLLELLNTGATGSLGTIHANSAELALRRLATCAMKAGVEIPYRVICSEIGDSIQVVVHMERKDGRRRVTEIIEVLGYNPDSDNYRVRQV